MTVTWDNGFAAANLTELRHGCEMEHWEFLLQKEGDRSWLPLDAPDVEILEGRYRVVARSNYSNAAIDIRIAHLAIEEVPPKRRIQKRSCRTNQDGLMVVIPFTHLEAGQWELCCSPVDLMSDLMAGAQPHALKLQVVAHSSEEDWEPDWTSPTSTPSDLNSVSASQRSTSEPSTLSHDISVTDPAIAVDGDASTLPTITSPPLPVAPERQPIPLPPEVAEILAGSMDRLFQIAEQMSEQLVDEVLQDFELTAIANAPVSPEAIEADAPTLEPATITSPGARADEATDDLKASTSKQKPLGYTLAANQTFVLSLDQDTLIATRGDVMSLSGQVAIASAPLAATHPTAPPTPPTPPGEADVRDPWESELALDIAGATAQEIQLCLRDPQSLQVLVSDRQPLPSQPLPYAFSFSVALPDTLTTHLVLGEVLLCGVMAGKEDTSIALVTQAFSITVDPGALVSELSKLHEALATNIEDEERIDLPLELSSRLQEQAAPSVDLSFLDWGVAEPARERSPRFPSLAGQPLPPQLYRPDPNEVRSKALDLPAFKHASEPEATAQANPPASSKTTPVELSSSEAAPNSLETAPQTDLAEAAQAPLDALSTAKTRSADPLVITSVQATPSDVSVAAESTDANNTDNLPLELPSPTQMSFRSLKLQDRFLTRLTSLATDTELSALLKANIAPGQPLPPPQTAASAADARALTEEIVVDDEPQPLERRRSKPPTVAPAPAVTVGAVPSETPPNPLILPPDAPVPTPTLDVITGELTAGKPINIRVRLPSLQPRIYVKLWVIDRQTRSLLDGPRWLVDFLPNGLGDLEAMTPLTVPFGSVELRFEAIAVEMHTQRESHKVTVDRVVIPPDLPSVSLDDFHP